MSAQLRRDDRSGYDETTASGIWGINGEDSNITMILDYFKNSTLENKERGYLGTAEPDAARRRGLPFLARLSRAVSS